MVLVIGSAGASLTEVILLKSIFKNQLIVAFLAVIIGMAVLTMVAVRDREQARSYGWWGLL